LLAGGVGVAGAVALAACSSPGSRRDASTSDAANGSGGAPNPESDQPSGQGGAPASSSAAQPAGAIAPLAGVPVGGSIGAHSNGKAIVLAQPAAGSVVGFSAICTHMGCTVDAGGPQLHCPCHGSIYNAFTGAVIQGPAPSPLPAVAVHVSGGYVVAG
jgi:Rieske Fe-S protein